VASLDNAPRVAYRGFISYSHRDAGIGKSIHRRLEAYRLPNRLIGGETVRGAVPARLTPIFRDREELSAGESLSDQVQAALAASDCLIVLCSPDAKASKWVAKEIETFRALHPDRPVLAALISGEPEEAFPESLIADGAEPIAADFRKGGDGQRLALLKIVAGMAAVPLDALVQRDAQRQMRRVMAITLTALLAVLAMALLLVMAVRAEREAKRQRQQAEGLVEYMLTDLRDRLKGVGRLDVMTAVNERAMGYYGAQGDLDALPPESLDRRARILHAMGEDDEVRGDLGKALAKFTEAHRATAIVLAQRPDDPDAILSHARSEYWLGYSLQKQGAYRAAVVRYSKQFPLLEHVLMLKPDDLAARKEVGWAHNAIGVALSIGLEDGQNALMHFQKYRDVFAALARENPTSAEVLFSLSDAHAWVADANVMNGRDNVAESERRSQARLLDTMLKKEPENRRYAWARIGADRALFKICHRAGRDSCSSESIDAAAKRFSAITHDPENLEWLWMAASLEIDKGLQFARGNRRADCERATLESTRLTAAYRESTDSDPRKFVQLRRYLSQLNAADCINK
jgi:tetratricopeptide (TPR) repeat protein